jgi:hypothetical protein
MALEEVGMTPEEVMQVRDRPLEDSYKIHDVGQDVLTARLEAHGYHVEDHGDDARYAEEVYYGDGPDVAVYQSGDRTAGEAMPLAYIEIKCKESAEWFGRCNRRHFEEYVTFAAEHDVPVFIWFALVDSDSGIVHRSAFFEVTEDATDQIDGEVVDVSDQEVVFHAEDIHTVDGGENDLRYVEASDVVGVRPRDDIVERIPNVHGNEVVCLNEDQLRSFAHLQRRLDG